MREILSLVLGNLLFWSVWLTLRQIHHRNFTGTILALFVSAGTLMALAQTDAVPYQRNPLELLPDLIVAILVITILGIILQQLVLGQKDKLTVVPLAIVNDSKEIKRHDESKKSALRLVELADKATTAMATSILWLGLPYVGLIVLPYFNLPFIGFWVCATITFALGLVALMLFAQDS